MIDPLYQKEILRLAAVATGAGAISDADGQASVRNPLCGDQVTVFVRGDAEKIDALAHETRACVLCQASASLLARTVPGLATPDVLSGEARIRAFLKGDETSPWPDAFKDYAVFQPVIEHTGRHTCILLPFEAMAKALAALNPDSAADATTATAPQSS